MKPYSNIIFLNLFIVPKWICLIKCTSTHLVEIILFVKMLGLGRLVGIVFFKEQFSGYDIFGHTSHELIEEIPFFILVKAGDDLVYWDH